jgi:hypothetical protein
MMSRHSNARGVRKGQSAGAASFWNNVGAGMAIGGMAAGRCGSSTTINRSAATRLRADLLLERPLVLLHELPNLSGDLSCSFLSLFLVRLRGNGGVGPRHRSLSTPPNRTTLAASDGSGHSAAPRAHLPQSSSTSRFTAGASEFFILSQSGERPER